MRLPFPGSSGFALPISDRSLAAKKRGTTRLLILLLLSLLDALASISCSQAQAPAHAQAQSRDGATIVFHFERPGVALPAYQFTVHEDRSAAFTATYYPPTPAKVSYTALPVSERFAEPLTLSVATTAALFEQARSAKLFAAGCASKAKNIADTGTKTLSYTGPDGKGSCTYNYTENKTVAALTDTFLAMALTIEAGHRLEFKHRFDLLALDPEMAFLVEATRDGHAVELRNIASILTALADDPRVLERVRTRAVHLLQGITPDP